MSFAALIPTLAPLILEALEDWRASGRISEQEYEEAKRLYSEARVKSQQSVDDFKAWLNEQD